MLLVHLAHPGAHVEQSDPKAPVTHRPHSPVVMLQNPSIHPEGQDKLQYGPHFPGMHFVHIPVVCTHAEQFGTAKFVKK